MKKIYWALCAVVAVVAVVLAVVCCHGKDVDPEPTVVTFNEAVQADYDYLSERHEHFKLNEVQTMLSTTIDEGKKETEIVSMTTVAQVKDTVFYFIRENGPSDTVRMEYELGLWVGDFDFSVPVNVDYEMALSNLVDSCDTLPHTRYMTLRNPVGPTRHENPFYLFGNPRIGMATVDAGTGEVNTFKY